MVFVSMVSGLPLDLSDFDYLSACIFLVELEVAFLPQVPVLHGYAARHQLPVPQLGNQNRCVHRSSALSRKVGQRSLRSPNVCCTLLLSSWSIYIGGIIAGTKP